MNTRGARVLITDQNKGRIWEEYVDPRDVSMGLPGMAQAVAAMKETLPPIVRRNPRERFRSMLDKVLPQMLEQYRATGRCRWPASVQRTLTEISLAQNDPTLTDEGGVEQVIRQGKALTQWLSETGERQQAAQDSRKVTLDWSGH